MRHFDQRVAVYVDGFNLFYGLRDKGWRRYYWLDVRKLAENLLRPRQTLAAVRYFTARVYPDANDPGKVARQNTYLEALGTIAGLSAHYGHFLPRTRRCPKCGELSQTYEEKMTDVNIAVEMVRDAHEDLFDAAITVSADSDLSRPITAIRERFPDKRLIVAFPPNRSSSYLRRIADAVFSIGRATLRNSQLPEQIAKQGGIVLTRPSSWS